MKSIMVILIGLFALGAISFAGIVNFADSWPTPFLIAACIYLAATMILLLVMLIAAPKMSKMMKGKETK